MKAIMLVAPKTYSEQKGKCAYMFQRDSAVVYIDLQPDMCIDKENIGYLLVDNQYVGAYNLEASNDGESLVVQ
jgi:hypothetical protein